MDTSLTQFAGKQKMTLHLISILPARTTKIQDHISES